MKHLLRTIFGAVAIAVPSAGFAQGVDLVCAMFEDGVCAADNVLMALVPLIAALFAAIAGGASVLFVVVGGGLMLISAGDESQVTRGKMSIIYALIGLAITLLAQSIVAFFTAQFGSLHMSANPVVQFTALGVGAIVFLFNSVFALMAIAAGFRAAFARGNADEFNKARAMITWAIVGAVIVNIARSLVAAVLNLPL
jgi:hypothetical protein